MEMSQKSPRNMQFSRYLVNGKLHSLKPDVLVFQQKANCRLSYIWGFRVLYFMICSLSSSFKFLILTAGGYALLPLSGIT
jgi:hypothetical protein